MHTPAIGMRFVRSCGHSGWESLQLQRFQPSNPDPFVWNMAWAQLQKSPLGMLDMRDWEESEPRAQNPEASDPGVPINGDVCR
jgi:hypothetical protein